MDSQWAADQPDDCGADVPDEAPRAPELERMTILGWPVSIVAIFSRH